MGLKLPQRGVLQRRIRPEMYDVSNIDANGDSCRTNRSRWHRIAQTRSFTRTARSTRCLRSGHSCRDASSRLSARIRCTRTRAPLRRAARRPQGEGRARGRGALFWKTRGRAGFDDITAEMKRAMPPVPQNVVRTIPESGRKALLIGNHATHVLGWPVEEGERFLDELNAFATQAQFVYTHKWRAGDLVIWDNRCTLHRATPYEVSSTSATCAARRSTKAAQRPRRPTRSGSRSSPDRQIRTRASPLRRLRTSTMPRSPSTRPSRRSRSRRAGRDRGR